MAGVAFYATSLAILACIYGIIVTGLNVQWGFAGILNFGVAAFVAIGAYTYGLVTLGPPPAGSNESYILGLQAPFLIGLLAAAVAGGVTSWLLGAVALRRVRSDYLAITTLAFSQIVWVIAGNETWLVNGWDGLAGIPRPFNEVLELSYGTYDLFFLALCLVVLAAVTAMAEVMLRAPFGRILRGVREDALIVASFGRNATSLRLRAFVTGSVMASIGGALLAAYVGAFNPSAFLAGETFVVWTALLIGGPGNTLGALLGAIVVPVVLTEGTRFLPHVTTNSQFIEALRYFTIGVVLILVLRFRPQGLLPERPRTHERAPWSSRWRGGARNERSGGNPPHA